MAGRACCCDPTGIAPPPLPNCDKIIVIAFIWLSFNAGEFVAPVAGVAGAAGSGGVDVPWPISFFLMF
jgi:hypothetical protein